MHRNKEHEKTPRGSNDSREPPLRGHGIIPANNYINVNVQQLFLGSRKFPQACPVTDMGMQEKLSGQTSRNDDHGQYPDQRQQQTEQAPEDVSARDSAEQEKPPPNGGVNSWLNVAAAFCVFVNTWYALANNVEVQHSRIGILTD